MRGYGQFCPVAKAMEVIGERWTILIVRELIHGCLSFNKIRNGVPLMSPSLLSSRLKTLEYSGIIVRKKTNTGIQYSLTNAGKELKPIIMHMGIWGQRWVRSDMKKKDLDPRILMWDMMRRIDTSLLPDKRIVIFFEFTNYTSKLRRWWLVVNRRDPDICLKDPGYDIDLQLVTDIRTMSQIWMGDLGLREALKQNILKVTGDRELKRNLPKWLALNVFADIKPAMPSAHS